MEQSPNNSVFMMPNFLGQLPATWGNYLPYRNSISPKYIELVIISADLVAFLAEHAKAEHSFLRKRRFYDVNKYPSSALKEIVYRFLYVAVHDLLDPRQYLYGF